MNRSSVLVAAAAALSLAGCPPPQVPPATTQPIIGDRPVTVGDKPTTQRSDQKSYVLLVRLRLASIEVPVGRASGTEELWSYLDEEAIASVHGAGLGLNGIRVGIGRKGTWPDVVKVLQKMTGRKLKEGNMVTLPGGTVPAELKTLQHVVTIFTFYPDRTLTGADFPPGDYLLTLSSTVSEGDPSTTIITGLPQIRTTKRVTRIVTKGGRPMVVSQPQVFSFRPLTFQVTVPQKDFLVIGPGTESSRPNSVGHHFFVKEKDGLEFETVLVIVPEVFATPLRPAKLPMRGPTVPAPGT